MKNSISRIILPERLYHQIDTLKSYRPLPFDVLRRQYKVEHLPEGSYLQAAKKLHAKVYFHRGYVNEQDLEQGIIHQSADPYQTQAHYFGVFTLDNQIVAVARQIYQTDTSLPLPIFKHVKLYKEYRHLHPSQMVEISAFAKEKGTDSRALLLLFHAMMQHSKVQHHRYWLLACDTQVYWRMKSLFGPLLRVVGPETFYMGSNIIPAEIDIDNAPKYLRDSYRRSLPPVRNIRKFLYSSFTEFKERKDTTAVVKPSRFWDQYAKAYDGLLNFYPYRHLVEHISEKVLALKPSAVLDLGSGTGNVTAYLATRDPRMVIDAVDWSSAMLAQIKHKVPSRRVNIYERDLLVYLRKTRKTYDVIVMNNVVYTIPDREALWRLLYKRLNKNGYLVFANPDTANSTVLIHNHLRHAPKKSILHAKLLKVWLFDAAISLFGLTSSYDFSSEPELRHQLNAHGFQIMGKIERCYGGHEKGIDLLVTARKTSI